MIKNILQNPLFFFKKIAFLEGCSFLLFGLTMPVKYLLKIPQPNYVVGMVHGFLFMAYCLLLVLVWNKHKWSFTKACLAFVLSLIPFGTFWGDKKVFNTNKDLRS